MKLLLVTQAVDEADPFLSFFVTWITELAKRVESIEVICLTEGKHVLPTNVRVHSLGKERGRASKVAYAIRFIRHVWRLRHEYDRVFIHMNEEYLLVGGWLFAFLGKPVYLWRNHYAGSWRTYVAALFCRKIFSTSMHSYTGKFKKTVRMPVGVDTNRFGTPEASSRKPRSILFFARITPAKRPDLFIEALGLLLSRGVSFVASVYGPSLPEDAAYHESLKAKAEAAGLHDRIQFHPGVPNDQAPKVFETHDIYVNCAGSGMFDKMLFEAAASGCLVLAESEDWKELVGEELVYAPASEAALAERLAELLTLPEGEKERLLGKEREVVRENQLTTLMDRLVQELV